MALLEDTPPLPPCLQTMTNASPLYDHSTGPFVDCEPIPQVNGKINFIFLSSVSCLLSLTSTSALSTLLLAHLVPFAPASLLFRKDTRHTNLGLWSWLFLLPTIYSPRSQPSFRHCLKSLPRCSGLIRSFLTALLGSPFLITHNLLSVQYHVTLSSFMFLFPLP